MKSVRISVLMPAYNAQEYIGLAIESIQKQTFSDFEFIIINDGSTDDTAKIVEKYAKSDKRIKFINNSKNQGLISVLNEGLKLSTGEYIARMDSDDISLPTRFEKQIEYMDKHPECGVLGTWYETFGNHNYVVKHYTYVGIIDLLYENKIAHPTVMLRKSVLDKYNLKYDENYKHAEDYDLWARMIMVTQIHNLPEILLKYRWHNTNISVTCSEQQIDTSNRVRQNILYKLTEDKQKQAYIMRCTSNYIKSGILLPKWFGRFICVFIIKREARHRFRDKYVK